MLNFIIDYPHNPSVNTNKILISNQLIKLWTKTLIMVISQKDNYQKPSYYQYKNKILNSNPSHKLPIKTNSIKNTNNKLNKNYYLQKIKDNL